MTTDRGQELMRQVLGPRPEGGTVTQWAEYLHQEASTIWAFVIKDDLRSVRPTPGDEKSGPWKIYSPRAPEYKTIEPV